MSEHREQPNPRHLKGYGYLLELLLEMKHRQVKHLKSTPYLLSHYCPLKRIQKKKIISNTISISQTEQPVIFKKMNNEKGSLHHGNVVLRMEQVLCTQEEEMNDDQNQNTQNQNIQNQHDHHHSNIQNQHQNTQNHVNIPNSMNECIAPQIESEVMLNSSEQFENLISMTHPYDKISQFIKSLCKKLIPLELFGSLHNRNIIFNNIDRIVSLGRYETLTLHELMQNIKVNDMKWTYPKKDVKMEMMLKTNNNNNNNNNPTSSSSRSNKNHQQTTRSNINHHQTNGVDLLQFKKQTFMAQQFILFLFKHIIMILLSTHFYITESDQQRTKLLYFRRETWEYINRVSWSKINNHDSQQQQLSTITTTTTTRTTNTATTSNTIHTINNNNNNTIHTINNTIKNTNNTMNNKDSLRVEPSSSSTHSTTLRLFQPIEKELALQMLKKKSLPYTSVRLLPKQNTARPIINLGKRVMNNMNTIHTNNTNTTNHTRSDPFNSEFSHSYSVNSKLRDLLSILKFETHRNPELLGSSVFNPLDMYKRLLPFVRMWKEQLQEVNEKVKNLESNLDQPNVIQGENFNDMDDIRNNCNIRNDNIQSIRNNRNEHLLLPLYIVKIDIKGAYDSIPHQKLFQLISNSIIREEEYISVKYNVIRPYIGKIISKYERVIMCPNQFMRFTKLLNSQLSYKYCKSIFIDQVSYTSINANDIHLLLKEHISQNLIKIKNEFYIQVVGIPQGSIVSPLLCSLLYADFEKECLNWDLPNCGVNGHTSGGGDDVNGHTSGGVNGHGHSNSGGHACCVITGTGSGGGDGHHHLIQSCHVADKEDSWKEDSTLKYFIHVLLNSTTTTNTTMTACTGFMSESTTIVHENPGGGAAATTTTSSTSSSSSSNAIIPTFTPPISFMRRELVPLCSPIGHDYHSLTTTTTSAPTTTTTTTTSTTTIRMDLNTTLSPLLFQEHHGRQVDSTPPPPSVFQQEGLMNQNDHPQQHQQPLSNSSNSSFLLVSSIGVLLRLIDDFLYVTNNKNAAQYFLETMHAGNPEYGIRINPKKTKVNYETSVKVTSLTKCEYHAERLIRWCGFNIDTQTLNITVDYSRYWDCHLKDKISRDCRTPGFNLCRKLKQTISWKCTPLVIDGTVNSRFTCYLNIYQLFLFVAMKFHTTIRHKMKPQWNKSNLAHKKSAYNLCKTIISDIIGYMWICIQSRKKVIHKFRSMCELDKLCVQYLGVCAFHKILQKKHSHYAPFEIMTQLRIAKRNLLNIMAECRMKQLMNRVTDRRFSTELLNHIQF